MTAHQFHQGKRVCRALDPFADDHRREKFAQRCPAGIRPLVAIKRSFSGRALAPPLGAVGIDNAREDNASLSGATETCFEKVDERQAYFAQFNRLDKQSKKVFLRETHYARLYAELTTRIHRLRRLINRICVICG